MPRGSAPTPKAARPGRRTRCCSPSRRTGAGSDAGAAGPARPGHRGGVDEQRPALVVLPAPARALSRPGAGKRRSGRRDRRGDRARAGDRQRRLRRSRAGRAGEGARHRGQALRPRRARRPAERPHRSAGRGPGAGRFRGPHQQGHPRRDLAQALGQPLLQPGQRPEPRHARSHLPRSGRPGRWSRR